MTWLVPHALSQVLPPDVDYKVMLTFLEFYNTLLQFVNFKLYHNLGVSCVRWAWAWAGAGTGRWGTRRGAVCATSQVPELRAWWTRAGTRGHAHGGMIGICTVIRYACVNDDTTKS